MKKISAILTILFIPAIIFCESTNTSTNTPPHPPTSSPITSPPTENESSQTNFSSLPDSPFAPSNNSSETTDIDTTDEPAPYPQEIKKEKKPVKKKKTGPPKKYGDCTGDYMIGQRIVASKHAGWGWLKYEGSTWRHAKWIMLEEKPGKIEAPSRFHHRPNDDHNMQYKLYGEFADYKGYEPNVDSLVPVFILKGFEVIGRGPKISRKPPGPSGNRKGRISTRDPRRQWR